MQRAGKQQKAEHPRHQGVVKIDVREGGPYGLVEPQTRDERVKQERRERHAEGNHHEADGVWQAEPLVVHPAEHRRQRDDERDEIEQGVEGHSRSLPTFSGGLLCCALRTRRRYRVGPGVIQLTQRDAALVGRHHRFRQDGTKPALVELVDRIRRRPAR